MAHDSGLVDEIEATIEACSASLLDTFQDVLMAFGSRPATFVKGDALDQLSVFVEVRDNPQAWEQHILSWMQTRNLSRLGAEIVALIEFARLEKMLVNRGGAEGVQYALLLRRLGRAEQALAAADKLEAKPKIRIVPPLALVDVDALIGGAIPDQWAPRAPYDDGEDEEAA